MPANFPVPKQGDDHLPNPTSSRIDEYATLCDTPPIDASTATGGMFAAIGQAIAQAPFQVAAFMDYNEQCVTQELQAKGYSIVRNKFKPDLPPGAVGKGSFGLVYKATRGNTVCGIKMIEHANQVKHLVAKEIDTLGMFRHPAMVNYIETIEAPGKDWIFIVQEFAEGGDVLGALTQQPHVFDEALIRVLLYHCCCALGVAHARGIMHRDLKPENVLLTEDGFPKVADFGLARNLNASDMAATQAGTPVYMAPEIKEGRPYDFSVDVYSMGLILQDMMAKNECMEWYPVPAQYKQPKKWPPGHQGHTFSEGLKKLCKSMADKNPRSRPTFFSVVRQLEKGSHPNYRHPFWSRQVIKPGKEPARGYSLTGLFTPDQGAAVAAKYRIEVGKPVEIKHHQKWLPGVVERISEAIIPGAAHVRFTDPNDQTSRVRVVDPCHFGEYLVPQGGRKGKGCGTGACCALM